MPALAPSLLAPAGLIGGFAAARYSGKRALGGLVFAAAGAGCVRGWARASGPGAASGLTALYVAAMGGSHPLAKKLGPWCSVFAVTAASVAASQVVTRHAGKR
jgi:hypothetical protein